MTYLAATYPYPFSGIKASSSLTPPAITVKLLSEEQVETLRDLIKDLSWDEFEKIKDGDIRVWDPVNRELIKFSLRVGKHMGRPSRAIIALQHFVRLELDQRFGKEFEHLLHRLDPAVPDSTMYISNWDPRIYLSLYQQTFTSVGQPQQVQYIGQGQRYYYPPNWGGVGLGHASPSMVNVTTSISPSLSNLWGSASNGTP